MHNIFDFQSSWLRLPILSLLMTQWTWIIKYLRLYAVCDAEFATEHQEISESVIRKAFSATEEGFLSLVKKQWLTKPQIASVGSCCLAGIICNGLLYIANVGDSRAVLGRAERASREVTAIQLSTEHNASIESVREELRSLHPHDKHIVVLRHKVWRVKGLIQVISWVLHLLLACST